MDGIGKILALKKNRKIILCDVWILSLIYTDHPLFIGMRLIEIGGYGDL